LTPEHIESRAEAALEVKRIGCGLDRLVRVQEQFAHAARRERVIGVAEG
jgi:hypothetical protein